MDAVRASVTVDTSPERAFEVFTERMSDWWPKERRLVLLWQIAGDRSPQPDPDRSSEVEVRFAEQDGGARVDVEHRGWERHGEGAQEYRDGFERAGAWPYALERFAAAAAR